MSYFSAEAKMLRSRFQAIIEAQRQAVGVLNLFTGVLERIYSGDFVPKPAGCTIIILYQEPLC